MSYEMSGSANSIEWTRSTRKKSDPRDRRRRALDLCRGVPPFHADVSRDAPRLASTRRVRRLREFHLDGISSELLRVPSRRLLLSSGVFSARSDVGVRRDDGVVDASDVSRRISSHGVVQDGGGRDSADRGARVRRNIRRRREGIADVASRGDERFRSAGLGHGIVQERLSREVDQGVRFSGVARPHARLHTRVRRVDTLLRRDLAGQDARVIDQNEG